MWTGNRVVAYALTRYVTSAQSHVTPFPSHMSSLYVSLTSHLHHCVLLWLKFPVVLHAYHWSTTGMLSCTKWCYVYLSLNYNEGDTMFVMYPLMEREIPPSITKFQSGTIWCQIPSYVHTYRRILEPLLLCLLYFNCSNQWLYWLFDIRFIHQIITGLFQHPVLLSLIRIYLPRHNYQQWFGGTQPVFLQSLNQTRLGIPF
jgi:hypothetical protein